MVRCGKCRMKIEDDAAQVCPRCNAHRGKHGRSNQWFTKHERANFKRMAGYDPVETSLEEMAGISHDPNRKPVGLFSALWGIFKFLRATSR